MKNSQSPWNATKAKRQAPSPSPLEISIIILCGPRLMVPYQSPSVKKGVLSLCQHKAQLQMIGLGMLNYVTPATHQCTIHLKPIIMTSYHGWSLSCGPSLAMGPYCNQYKSIVCFFLFPDCPIAPITMQVSRDEQTHLGATQTLKNCVLFCLLVFILCPKV